MHSLLPEPVSDSRPPEWPGQRQRECRRDPPTGPSRWSDPATRGCVFRPAARASSRSNGFTLVEVVVGMVLLGSLLVGVLQAYGAHHRQLRLSRDRIIATQIADDMLAAWDGGSRGLPVSGRGLLAEQPGWWWRTHPIVRRSVAGLPVDVIRFEILSSEETSQPPRLLSSIEVFRPVERLSEQRTQ